MVVLIIIYQTDHLNTNLQKVRIWKVGFQIPFVIFIWI